MNYKQDLIERLYSYKKQFLQDIDFKDLQNRGISSLNDYLDGIEEEYDGKYRHCIVSYILTKLDKNEIEEIENSMPFEVILSEPMSIYNIHDLK